jgi:hypothetical protein
VICSLFSPLQALSLAIASKLLGFDFEFVGEGRGVVGVLEGGK